MLARIDGEKVIEKRDISIEDVPEHKRDWWRPVVFEGAGDQVTEIVETDKVRVVRSYRRSLDEMKSIELRRIDALFAEALGTNPSLSKVHRMKAEEAEEILANGVDSPENFPLLNVSKLEGESLEDAAVRIHEKFKADEGRLAQLEVIRLTAKANIRAAQDVDELQRVQASIDWTVK